MARITPLVLLVAACGDGASDRRADSPDADDPPAVSGTCDAIVTHETPLMAASHVPQDSAVDWTSNPPSSGPHYPTLTAWAIEYPIVIARGNYVHNEEHGGIVLLYNCPDTACPEIAHGLAAIGRALPQDPACVASGVNARWIVTRDPLLPAGVTVAAAAWGWTYKASCLDPDSLNAFITARYAQGGSDRTNCKL